jgi:hypothetical protein
MQGHDAQVLLDDLWLIVILGVKEEQLGVRSKYWT